MSIPEIRAPLTLGEVLRTADILDQIFG